MILQAIQELEIDPTLSFLVGDKLSDVQAARAAGAQGILVRTGQGAMDAAAAAAAGFPVLSDLSEAARFIEEAIDARRANG